MFPSSSSLCQEPDFQKTQTMVPIKKLSKRRKTNDAHSGSVKSKVKEIVSGYDSGKLENKSDR